MRAYETMYILRPRVSEKEIEELKNKIEKLVREHKGELKLHQSLGKKPLSYEMKKEKEGIYVHADYSGEGTLIPEIERILRFDERVIRFLTTTAKEVPHGT